MTKLKAFLKNIVVAVILTAILVGLGFAAVISVSNMELRTSAYTRTEFDFHIAAPNAAQIEEIAKNPSVKNIFPYYAYRKAFSVSDDLLLMVSDEMDKLSSSIFSDAMLIEGEYKQNGAVLDKTAADLLNVKVGDTITFTLLGKKTTQTVVAIYLPSTLALMEKGVVAIALPEDMAAPAAYGGAFIECYTLIDYDGRGVVADLLSDYVGEGNIALSYEQYVEIHCNAKKPDQTDEEYEAECRQKYEDYRNGIIESVKKGGGQVTDKREAYSLLKEQVLTTEKSTKTLMILAAVIGFVFFMIAGSLFIVTNVGNDRLRIEQGVEGMTMLTGYVVSSALTAFLVAAMTALGVLLIASGTYFISDCIFIVLSTALPVLAGIPVVVIVAFAYIHKLCKNSAVPMKKKSEKKKKSTNKKKTKNNHNGNKSGNAPVDNASVDKTPVDKTPVDKTPVDKTPVDNAPVYYSDEKGAKYFYDKYGNRVYDNNGSPVYRDKDGKRRLYYDEHGAPVYYDKNGNPVGCDRHGNPFYNEDGERVYYENDDDLVFNGKRGIAYYTENGNFVRYEENGAPVYYDKNGHRMNLDKENHFDGIEGENDSENK